MELSAKLGQTMKDKRVIRRLLLFAISALILVLCCKPLWLPIYVKLTGGRSVDEVVHELQESGRFSYRFNDQQRLSVLCFKTEQKVELWLTRENGIKELVKSFSFTGNSGTLGPKLKRGDLQIPEGIYALKYLNPNSRFHLSLKIDYPNAFDREKGKRDGRKDLGDDIFIHGKSATVGCIPIGDRAIEELFFMAAELGKDKVEVVIAPYDMRTEKKLIRISAIDWEDELYALLEKKLNTF